MLAASYSIGVNNILHCSFDACAIVLVLIVIINYSINRKIRNRSAELFSVLSFFALATAVLNLLAIMVMAITGGPDWLKTTLVLLHYITYGICVIVFMVYTVAVIHENNDIPISCYIGTIGVNVVLFSGVIMAAVCLFGGYKKTFMGNRDLYQFIYELIIYGATLLALGASLVMTIKHRKKLSKLQHVNVYMFICINFMSIIIQQITLLVDNVARMQVGSFGISVALLLIYMSLQRPEADLDKTSGLFNRRTYLKTGTRLIDSDTPFTVFAFQLSNFTFINSMFGASGGNEVIAQMGARIRKVMPRNSYVYRLEGVQFASIFTDKKQLENFSNKYLSLFNECFTVGGNEVKIKATAVVVEIPKITKNIADVSDILRYYRKSEKANDPIIVADTDSVSRIVRKDKVEYAINRALSENNFKVFYQPIWSVKDKKFNSCEALLRLIDPELGFISPDEFIPISEQNGTIVAVGKYVVESVCRFISEKKPTDYGIEFIDVNLSVIQCMHPEIVEDIDKILKRYDIPRETVNLEVTETASAQSYALLESKLNELHRSGFTISLDDFGTGFSSVEYLINFPFDVVKLDKSLVWAYMSTEKYEPILKHYMPMLHSLGTKIVAEGVETKEMVDALTELGCDYLQGYYFSKPVPEEHFMEFIKKNAADENIA